MQISGNIIDYIKSQLNDHALILHTNLKIKILGKIAKVVWRQVSMDLSVRQTEK